MKKKYLTGALITMATFTMFPVSNVLTVPEVSAAQVSKSDAVEGLFGGFVLGYWKNDGSPKFMLEGEVGIKGVTFTSKNVTKTLELVSATGEITEVTAASTNWYDKNNYTGYQAVLRESLLPNLTEGDYQMRIRVAYDDKEILIPINNDLAGKRAGGINEYITDINKVNSFQVGKTHYNFKAVMGELVLNVRNFTPDANPISKYMNGDGSKRVHDGWLNVDYDFNNAHQKNIIIKDDAGKEVYRKDKLAVWDINKQYGLGQADSLAKSGFQGSFPKQYDDAAYTPYVELKDTKSGELVGTYQLYEDQKVELPELVIEANATNVIQGETVQFTSNYNENTTWTIEGQTSKETTIDKKGLLTVGKDETAQKVTIKAESGDQSATQEINVIEKLTISAAEEFVVLGSEVQFTSNYKNDTKWSVKGQKAADTQIDTTGLLTVDEDETAKTLTITATQGEQTVSQEVKVEEYLAVEADKTTAFQGETVQLTPNITGVKWSVTANNSTNTKIDKNGLVTIGKDETAKEIFVFAIKGEQSVMTKISVEVLLDIQSDKDSVVLGESLQLTPTYDDATLTLSGQESQKTKLDKNGVLSVDAKETAKMLTVTATHGKQTITKEYSVYELLAFNYYDWATVGKGHKVSFQTNYHDITSWKVEGNTSTDTTIDAKGHLIVAHDETAEKIKVIATGAGQTISKDIIIEELLEVTFDKTEVKQGDTVQFSSNNPTTKFEVMVGGTEETFVDENNLLTLDPNDTEPNVIVVANTETQSIFIAVQVGRVSIIGDNAIDGNISKELKELIKK